MANVFIKDETEVWVKATTEGKKENGMITCVVNATGERRTIKVADYKGFDVPKQNETSMDDLTDLKFLHEASILYNLKERYGKERIYTRSGDLIISINPFTWIPQLYSESMRSRYASRLVWETSNVDPRSELAPHVFEVRVVDVLQYKRKYTFDSKYFASARPWHMQNWPLKASINPY